MGELDPGNRSLLADEPRDRSERFSMGVAPDAAVFGADPALGTHGGGLDHHQARTTHRTASQVDQVPVSGQTAAA
jgi:hypothetical protein